MPDVERRNRLISFFPISSVAIADSRPFFQRAVGRGGGDGRSLGVGTGLGVVVGVCVAVGEGVGVTVEIGVAVGVGEGVAGVAVGVAVGDGDGVGPESLYSSALDEAVLLTSSPPAARTIPSDSNVAVC